MWHSSSSSGLGLAGSSCCFRGEERAHSGLNPFLPMLQLCLDGAAARLQVGTRVVLSGILRGGLSSPCPAPDADSYTFSRELVANLQLLVSLLPSPPALV